MTFQAFIDTIKQKTGMTPADFAREARAQGLIATGTTPEKMINWLQEEFKLSHKHAVAIHATLKTRKVIVSRPRKK
jgi:Domain of unknown function (DUF4287)